MRYNRLFIIFILDAAVFLSSVSSAEPILPQNTDVNKPEERFFFNGWYHGGKNKWRGPIHDKFIFTWITMMTTASSEKEYRQSIQQQKQNGVKYIGYYYSSTTSAPPKPAGDTTGYPEGCIPHSAINPAWVIVDKDNRPVTWPGDRYRYYLDVGLPQVQSSLLKRVIDNVHHAGVNLLYLDNWTYKFWSPGSLTVEQWTQKCLAFLKCARELTELENMKLIVNVTAEPETWTEFAQYLDGICYEMAAHPNRLRTVEGFERELNGYQTVLEKGKSIFLYTDTLTYNKGRWDEDGRKVAATALLVMPPEQPYWGGIYVASPRYEVWPVGGWPMWQRQLGNPREKRKWQGNTVTRDFEKGEVRITVGDEPEFKVVFKY
ncbi:MAG: hypothetical protein KJ757_00495 [Planctomycetes bacterium]|nr:hypothetical protein [Planctomycetota bacterium]MBU1518343.1 hypothetical protein [Planctomycetota bacterium]MBU2458564.1 hypothetical protein [Planctomycetota bacterium]MBU2596034.1 hypothetical protein [Planctomycetota bacterium]